MLVHICCSVDSHFFLQQLQEQTQDTKMVGYYYNPNIHPYSEYKLRLIDVTRSCDMLHIPLLVGKYDYFEWFERTKEFASEPEKGRRCDICFQQRFEQTAIKAKELGIKRFTSTLLASPKKSIKQLEAVGKSVAKRYGLEFVSFDLTKADGMQQQNILAKADKLYRQNYCGCFYALKDQRQAQNRVDSEMLCSTNYSSEPNSLEKKIELYEKRLQLEAKGQGYEIVKNRVLNYRLLHARVFENGAVIPSFILPYSLINGKKTKGRVYKVVANLAYFNKDEVKFCDISYFNTIAGTNFFSVFGLIRAKLHYKTLMRVRNHIANQYDFSAIIVTNSIPTNKLKIDLDAQCYYETVEELKPHVHS